jgi:type IV fimbrial biogenesis protein FimT
MTRRRLQGLTLIELMIGIGILAVLMSLAVPSFSAYLQRQRLKAAAQGLELDLREARYEAAQRGHTLGVVFSPGADWCYAITTTSDCDCRVQQACRLKTTRAVDLRGVHLVEAQNTRFDPANGAAEATGSTAVWATTGPERVQVSVSPMGRPHSCVLEGTLPPLPRC